MSEFGFKSWAFDSGMFFMAPNKWWGDFGKRDFPHEGLDLCLYKDGRNNTRRVDENTQIPVVQDGRIRAIFKDFLGYALIIWHDIDGGENAGFLSIYAHTTPRSDLHVGTRVKKKERIAMIAGTRRSKANILPHLHLSFGWPTQSMVYNNFEWNLLRDPDLITLLDPLDILGWPYEVIEISCESRRHKGLASTI